MKEFYHYKPNDPLPTEALAGLSDINEARAERDAAERRRIAEQTPVDRVGLRDYFAGQALAGLLACPQTNGQAPDFSAAAYEYADEMIKARAKRIE